MQNVVKAGNSFQKILPSLYSNVKGDLLVYNEALGTFMYPVPHQEFILHRLFIFPLLGKT